MRARYALQKSERHNLFDFQKITMIMILTLQMLSQGCVAVGSSWCMLVGARQSVTMQVMACRRSKRSGHQINRKRIVSNNDIPWLCLLNVVYALGGQIHDIHDIYDIYDKLHHDCSLAAVLLKPVVMRCNKQRNWFASQLAEAALLEAWTLGSEAFKALNQTSTGPKPTTSAHRMLQNAGVVLS